VDQAPESGRYPSAVARVCSPLQRERGPKARRLDQPGVKLSCVASREWHDATGLKSLDTRGSPPGRP